MSPDSETPILATRVHRTLSALAVPIPLPTLDALRNDRGVAQHLAQTLHAYTLKEVARDRTSRLARWRERLRTDWLVRPSRVWQWLRGPPCWSCISCP